MSSKFENEVALLAQYNKEIESMGDRLVESDPRSAKELQKQIDQKLQIYWKQVQLVRVSFRTPSKDGFMSQRTLKLV
jgi:hypothetical protein